MEYILIIILLLLANDVSRSSANEGRLLFGNLTNAHQHAITSGEHVIVVSKDGQGQHTSIADALNNIPPTTGTKNGRVVIYIKADVYEEYVTIDRENVTLLGDGINRTVLRSSRSDATHHDILASGALNAVGDGFVAIGISFENTAGAGDGRGVALRTAGDRSAFYRCSFSGFQDTLFVDEGRQFFRECLVEGTIDFIFGDAAAILQSCIIRVREPLPGQQNVITAQGRRRSHLRTGIVIQRCMVTKAPGNFTAKTYLGRPWKKFSRTVVMQSFIDQIVDPAGWMEMNSVAPNHLDKVVYREFENYGPGATTERRVHWPGFAVMNGLQARRYVVANFIQGRQWLPATGIPFNSYLR